jgi:glycosyltransferase involved in cell wall biosynthesis
MQNSFPMTEGIRKEVLIVHDDLNACGGSERLAATTIETLAEIGFNVDLATFTMPDLAKIQRLFGINLGGIRKIFLTNLYSVLNMKGGLLDVNTYSYDIVMNTHGDLLPFYEKHNDNNAAIKGNKSKINLTYCHYPLLPYQIRNGLYRTFLEKCIPGVSSFSVDKLFVNASSQYNLMMNNNTILTNSTFSAKAIKQLYHNVDPIILSPPVDIDKFRKSPYCSSYDKKQNMVLVVSRFSADKEIENAITLANLLKDRCLRGIREIKIIIVGNFSELNYKYIRFLEKMILDCGLENYVKLVFGASFDRLLDLMKRSKVYFHPLAGEPFGIAIVEAMASGLIPIVSTIGGSSEFVPSEYQYHTIQQAADMIANILGEINDDNALARSDRISNIVSKFSIQSYKKNLNNIIEYVMKTSKVEEAVILNKTRTRTTGNNAL